MQFCIFGHFVKGTPDTRWDQGESSYTACTADLSDDTAYKCDEAEWDEEKCPSLCGEYGDKMADLCARCGATMDVPMRTNTFVFVNEFGERSDCCSEHCVEELESQEAARFEQFIQSERDAEEMWANYQPEDDGFHYD